MTPALPSGATIRRKAAAEAKEMVIIALYLWVCFAALLLFKTAVLRGVGISYSPFGIAAVKALVLAKFILIGRAVKLGDRHQDRPLIWVTLRKSVVFLLLLIVLTAIEEIIVGHFHDRSPLQSLAEFGGGTRSEALVTCLIMWLILLPYFGVQSLVGVLGEGRLLRLFFVDRRWDPTAPAPGRAAG